ncbi:surfactin synthase thioesterase subunit [Streptomyces glaucescens]
MLTGDRDLRTPADTVMDWKRHGTQDVRFRAYEGGHFYLTEHIRQVAELITADPADPAGPLGRVSIVDSGR